MALDGKKRMVNNWNVWLNYNMLTTILLVEEDTAKRIDGIYKTMRSVDQFINYYKEDGACEEGPAYWSHAGGMLYNYLSLLQTATGCAGEYFRQALIKNIGTYICKAYIYSNWFLNYADAAARIKANAGLVYHFGKAVHEPGMQQFEAGWQTASVGIPWRRWKIYTMDSGTSSLQKKCCWEKLHNLSWPPPG